MMMMFKKLLELTIYCECNYPRVLPPGQAHTHTMWMLQTPKFLHCRLKNYYTADFKISSLQTLQPPTIPPMKTPKFLLCRIKNSYTSQLVTAHSTICSLQTPQLEEYLLLHSSDPTICSVQTPQFSTTDSTTPTLRTPQFLHCRPKN